MKKVFMLLIVAIFGIELVGCNAKSKNNDNEKYQGESVECINSPDDITFTALPSELDERFIATIYDENNQSKKVSAKIIEKNEIGEVIKMEFNNEIYILVCEGKESLWKKEN